MVHTIAMYMKQEQKAYICLVDQSIKLNRIGLISMNLVEKVVLCVTENSYRVTADTITENCRQSIIHGDGWKIVQRLGERVVEKEGNGFQRGTFTTTSTLH